MDPIESIDSRVILQHQINPNRKCIILDLDNFGMNQWVQAKIFFKNRGFDVTISLDDNAFILSWYKLPIITRIQYFFKSM
jgi:hypothetical protein